MEKIQTIGFQGLELRIWKTTKEHKEIFAGDGYSIPWLWWWVKERMNAEDLNNIINKFLQQPYIEHSTKK